LATTTLYGIKNCDTVKKARTWLDQQGIDYRFHDFRIDGLSAAQVGQWLKELGAEALINKRSTTWKGLDDATRANIDQRAAEIILANPTLIKRPLLDTGKRKHLGFKAADYQTLFNL
jgi:Spx/MgsR family transcriptional regulator